MPTSKKAKRKARRRKNVDAGAADVQPKPETAVSNCRKIYVPTSVAAQHFACSQRTIQRLVRSGKVVAKYTGGGHFRVGLIVNPNAPDHARYTLESTNTRQTRQNSVA